MTRKWHAKLWKIKGDTEHWHGAMAGIADPGQYADEIFSGGDYSSLFVYMFRRFGIPESGSDPYKEIACWYLTTTDPAVALIVSPRPSGLRYSFGYLVNTNAYGYTSHDDIEAIRLKIEPFLKQSMEDLLTPTNVRDVFINAMGKVKDDDVGRATCGYFKWAGFGVTSDYYEKFKQEEL
jgi:hypothetical protein